MAKKNQKGNPELKKSIQSDVYGLAQLLKASVKLGRKIRADLMRYDGEKVLSAASIDNGGDGYTALMFTGMEKDLKFWEPLIRQFQNDI